MWFREEEQMGKNVIKRIFKVEKEWARYELYPLQNTLILIIIKSSYIYKWGEGKQMAELLADCWRTIRVRPEIGKLKTVHLHTKSTSDTHT